MRHWHKRVLFGLTLLLGLSMVLSACGESASSSSQSSGPVQLTFWGFNQQIAEQADAFNKTHPNIHVTGLKQPSGPDQYYPKVLTAVKAGNAPDIALIEYQYIPTMVANQALVDLTKYGANDVKSQFDPTAWAQVVEGGAVYGYPQDTGPMGLFYNKATFQKAGIDHPPATWDEFAADAAKIHALGSNYYIVSFPPKSTGWIQALMWQAGAIWFSVDTQKNAWKVNINSDAAKKVADYWQGLLDKGLVATLDDFSNDWNAGLDKGTIASWPSAVWGQGVVKSSAADTSGKWAVAPMPQWQAGAKQVGFWGGSAISVVAGTKHPKEAEEFVRWYLTNETSLQIGVKEIGWFPSNLAARQYPEVTSPDPFFSNQTVDNTFTDITADPAWTWPPNLTAVNQMMGNDFATAVANKTPLSGALDQLQQQVVQDLQSKHINVES